MRNCSGPASVMTTVAGVIWHRGVDLHAYHDAILKKSLMPH
jgi:hypothetical protein